MNNKQPKLLHHLGVAFGFVGLMVWYYLADKLGLFTLFVEHLPSSHSGAALMLGIMLIMTPAFLIWKYYNRWLEKRLGIKGRYYEDGVFKDKSDAD